MIKHVDTGASGGFRGGTSVASQAIARGTKMDRLVISGVQNRPNRWTIQVSETQHITTPGASLNHCCDPTVIVHTIDEATVDIVAARDLVVGEELTFFYPSTEWVMLNPFICICRSARCLGLVGGAKYLTLDVLSHYYVNRHIRALASAALDQPIPG